MKTQDALKALLPSLQQVIHQEDSVDLMVLLEDLEEAALKLALIKHQGNRTHSAEQLRMNRTTLLAKMRRFAIAIPTQDQRTLQ